MIRLELVVPRSAAQIRTVHPHGFRSGEWADLLGVVVYLARPCYVVMFRDETTIRGGLELDLWVCEDLEGNYEYRTEAVA